MIVYISYLVQQEQLQQNNPVAVSCPENEWLILMTLETVIKVSISRFTNQTRLVLFGFVVVVFNVSVYRQYLVFACLNHLHFLVLITRHSGFLLPVFICLFS